MAKEDIVEHQFNNLTAEKQQEIASMGGKASGEARRRKRKMKDTLEILATLPFTLKDKNGNSIRNQLISLGVKEEDIDYEMAMGYSVLLSAIKGGKNQVQAATFIRDTLGDKPMDKVEISKSTEESINKIDDYIWKKKKEKNLQNSQQKTT